MIADHPTPPIKAYLKEKNSIWKRKIKVGSKVNTDKIFPPDVQQFFY